MRWEGRGGGEGRFSVAFCRLVYLLDEASACPYMEQHVALTEKVCSVCCRLCRLDSDVLTVKIISAVWTSEKPTPVTVKGIPPLQME